MRYLANKPVMASYLCYACFSWFPCFSWNSISTNGWLVAWGRYHFLWGVGVPTHPAPRTLWMRPSKNMRRFPAVGPEGARSRWVPADGHRHRGRYFNVVDLRFRFDNVWIMLVRPLECHTHKIRFRMWINMLLVFLRYVQFRIPLVWTT